MFHVRREQTQALEVEPGLFGVMLIDGGTGSHRVTLLRGWLHPGARHSPHTHDTEEAVVFLAGRGVVKIDGKPYEIGPGDAIWIPPSVIHSTENTGSEELQFVAAFSDSLVATYPVPDTGTRPRATPASRHPYLNRLRWIVRRLLRLVNG
jgi:quercetin dioxygenase-like cupin family protein